MKKKGSNPDPPRGARPAPPPAPPRADSVIQEIAVERLRQIHNERYDWRHDDEHDGGSLADAAACYAATTRPFKAEQLAGRAYGVYTAYSDLWPWEDAAWKPKDRRRDLIRAAALIVAEIERLDRAAAQ